MHPLEMTMDRQIATSRERAHVTIMPQLPHDKTRGGSIQYLSPQDTFPKIFSKMEYM